ncbi:metallophosphoesterase [Chitinispirillales bacterium ANBcel5]|uniref:metallophosphoesterase n=1 Tax=Cellulosispirillum alkaliphilum TaxID=3039283 RepID=UPI002A4F4512|nr:metallophosphoesterase [Chitinispirillales bacterium ANBcel5]
MKRRRFLVLKVVVLLLFLAGIYSLIEPYWYQEKTVVVQNQSIPQAFDGFRIVFLADIHFNRFFTQERLQGIVNRVNALDPDLILLGGDYAEGDPKYIDLCFEVLADLEAPYGVYGVLGNHEHWLGAEKSIQAMDEAGILSIDNNSFWIEKDGERIKVGGVGDLCEDVQKLEKTTGDVTEEDFVILVSHSPDYAEIMDRSKVDLMFAGHTHGGQITLFGLYAPKIPSDYGQKYRTGVVTHDDLKVIVSNGIGTNTLPVRFFARPQINVAILDAMQR